MLPFHWRSQKQLDGFSMELDLRDLLQTNIMVKGVWDPELSRWLSYLASSAQVIVDVGSHCGYFSLIAHRFAPETAYVYSFEPNPRLQAQYMRNVVINKFDRMRLVPMAVSDTLGTTTLYVPQMIQPGAGSLFRTSGLSQRIDTQTVTLDSFCDDMDIQRVDVVKMDIEGGEAAALAGMRQGLSAGRYSILVVEMHPMLLASDTIRSIEHNFREMGYNLFYLKDKEAQPVQGDMLLTFHGQVVAVHASQLPALHSEDGGRSLSLPEPFSSLFAG